MCDNTLDEVDENLILRLQGSSKMHHTKHEFWFLVKHSHISNTQNCSLVKKNVFQQNV